MSSRLRTSLCEMLGIEYPIVLAGMAGGPGTPELAAAVSAAGGLGTLGAAYLKPEEIREAVRRIRALTDRPFAINLFVPRGPVEPRGDERTLSTINRLRAELGLPAVEAVAELGPDRFDEQFAVLVEERVPIVGSTFGLFPEACRREARGSGMRMIAMATCVEEAIAAERSGADVIVAQGAEAGGHRGTFDLRRHPGGCAVGTFALVPQAADAVRVPVVAAGGVMDGRGLAAALMLGAQGVQMGTRFLAAAEAGTHPAYRQALLSAREDETEITNAFSGRPARGIRNRFIEVWNESGAEPYPFPQQNAMTREIRNRAAADGNTDYMSLWAGQGLRMLASGEPAAKIVGRVAAEARETLEGGGSRR